ncbi:MAG: FAD-dependent oxidoreductase, partial [Opitutales bacterium]
PFTYTKSLADTGTFDVIVVGSGSAGTSAAIAAGRAGASVLLLERLPFLGGISTAVLDTFYGFYTPGSVAKKVVGGVPDDVVAGLKRFDSWLERPNTHGAGTAVTYHPEYLKVVWEDLVRGAGVRVLLNAWVQDVEGRDGRVESLIVATKSGLQRFSAHAVVDCSGDADVCHFAGFGYELAGEIDPAQTLTTTFKMVNVDVPRRKSIDKKAFHQLMQEAAESGDYQLPRKEGSDHITPVNHMTATIMTRLPSYFKHGESVVNATDPQLLSDAEMDGRKQALEYIRFLRDKVPGYENAQLGTFGMQIGVRETRRVQGDYRLTREDVLEARKFDDQIGLCGAPIEDHHGGADTKWAYLPDGDCVGMPYRTLLPRDGQNVLVAGRCFSATHDAHASVRSMAQTMSMGQAAGTAAALAVRERTTPRELPVLLLRDELRRLGALLEMEDINEYDSITARG